MADWYPATGRGEWRRVSRRDKCPVCNHPDWCLIHVDGTAVLCTREASDIEKTAVDGNTFWVHRLEAEPKTWQRVVPANNDHATTQRANDDTLDHVYRWLLAALSLSETHRADLLRRGLEKPTIDALLFRTMPREGRADIAARLVERFGEIIAASVPGVYFKKTRWSLGGASGLIIPGLNVHGQITTIRIRADAGTRYTYLSSAGHEGPSAQQVVYVPTGAAAGHAREPASLLAAEVDGLALRAVRITEGEIKAAIATARTAVLTIAVPGAGSSAAVPATLEALGAQRVLIAFDQDKDERTRRIVERHREKLAAVCAELVGAENVGIETWPLDAGKGIDDVLVSGHGEKIAVQWAAQPRAESAPVAAPRRVKRVQLPIVGPAPVPIGDATAAFVATLAAAEDGLTVIASPPGIGKTNAAETVAIRRAQTQHRTLTAVGSRAPLHSKTAISVDKNDLAQQITANIRASGVPVRRLFGPLSAKNPDGTPVCHYHKVGSALAGGGQSVGLSLCEGMSADGGLHRCQYYHECSARLGSDGPAEARITVGSHGLLDSLDGEAGTTGLLVIDEPPPLLQTDAWDGGDLERIQSDLSAFAARYAKCLRPAVMALLAWVREAESAHQERTPVELVHVLEAYQAHVSPEVQSEAEALTGRQKMRDWILGARAEKQQHLPPPLQWQAIAKAKFDTGYAHHIGLASGLIGKIESAILEGDSHSLRIELRDDRYTLVLTSSERALLRAIRRKGSVAILDANADLNVPLYSRVVGYDLETTGRVKRFNVADGSAIQRALIRCKAANRTQWFSRGRPRWDTTLTAALREVVSWLLEDAGTRLVGFIAPKSLIRALQAFWDGSADTATLEALQPALGGWNGPPWVLGHYGGIRGKDNWKECDALITFMDPWPPKTDALNDAAFLGVADGGKRYTELCKAELEQAQGRLRTIHRARPGRALHVGNVVPGGMAWTSFEERAMPMGRPKNTKGMTADEFKAAREKCGMSQEDWAISLDISIRCVQNYESGARFVPVAVSEKVRNPHESLYRESICIDFRAGPARTKPARNSDALPDSLVPDYSPDTDRPSDDELAWEAS